MVGDGEFADSQDFRALDRDYVRGIRLRSASVEPGTETITATLYNDGRVVASRHVLADIHAGSSQSITLVISRDCRGVRCPLSGNLAFDTCLGGRCVDPRCTPETPEFCVPECTTNDECAGEFSSCAVPQCNAGVCLGRPDPSRCDIGEYCDGTLGCRLTPTTVTDAGMDASTDGGMDSAIDASLDGGRDAGDMTVDADVACGENERVMDHRCIDCPGDDTNEAGDHTSGEDTDCDDVCLRTLGVSCDEFAEADPDAALATGLDRFGRAIDLSGDTLVVGAFDEDSGATDINGDESDDSAPTSGAAYVFRRSDAGWTQEAYIKASNSEAGDHFGMAVAIDGDTLVVGAYQEDSAATGVNGVASDNSAPNAGAVYVFDRVGTTWTQQAYLKASNTDAEDFFGLEVALDGETLVVGARQEGSGAWGIGGDEADNTAFRSGAAYVFTRSGTTWTQQAYLKASNTEANDYFSYSLALAGDTLAIAAYAENSGASGVNGDQSDNTAENSGAVYVFTRLGTTWTQQAYLKASNPDAQDSFGCSVSLSGHTLAVGAQDESSAATGVDGDQSDNSFGRSGAVYVFVRVGTTWTQQAYLKASNTDIFDSFGVGVSLQGETLVIGAHNEDSSATGVDGDQSDNSIRNGGPVYLFRRSGTTWTQHAYIKSSSETFRSFFGVRLVLNADRLAIGSNNEVVYLRTLTPSF